MAGAEVKGKVENPVHLMGMRVENFCKITLAEMAPNGASVAIEGRNRQGKTSNCNALWAALGGADALKELGITQPVKKGAESAKVYVDMGEILVYREIPVEGKTKLLVTTADGFKLEPGQTVLDTFRGKFFDLSQFYRMEADKRLELVLSLIVLGGLDLAEWKAARKAVFDERTLVNREVATLKGAIDKSPEVEAPDEEVSVKDIADEQQQAQLKLDENNAVRQELRDKVVERDRCKENIAAAEKAVTSTEGSIEELRQQLKRLEERLVTEKTTLEGLNTQLATINTEGKAIQTRVEELKDPDMEGFSKRLSVVEETNVKVRAKKARAELVQKWEAKKEESEALTLKLTAFDRKKEKAIKAANFPVVGMGFDDADITYNDIPFCQSSDMERLVVGYGIAKMLSPRFKVMRLSRPGDLDPENLAFLYEMAEKDGIQILTEQVSDGAGGGLVIEDGILDGGTTDGVQKIMELAKPKRQKAAEAKEAAAETVKKVATDEELDALYEETVATKGAKGGKAKAAAAPAKEMPVAAPVEL